MERDPRLWSPDDGDRPTSARLYAEARQRIAGGVNSPSRGYEAVGGGHPTFIARGEGPYLYDVDGRRYIDYVAAYGALILGHAHPAIREAVAKAAAHGTVYGAPHALEVALAARLQEAIPSLELLRFVVSGTEAVMTAIRVARGFTGRPKIVKFAGCYHGHADPVLVAAGSGSSTLGIDESAGVTPGVKQDVITLPYNDTETLTAAFAAEGTEIAAVLVEPVVGNFGIVPPAPGFLEAIHQQAHRHGALVIWDEVITAFRFCYGSAQHLYGLQPDLTTLGKVIGGGLPIGAYGGRREVMAVVAPLGPVYQDGTLAGNPLSMAAGLACLEQLRQPGLYERLDQLGLRLAEGIGAAARRHGIPLQIGRLGGALSLYFGAQEPVRDFAGAAATDGRLFARFFRLMLQRGIHLAPSKYEAWFVTAAHGDEEIAATLEAVEWAFAHLLEP